MICRRLKNCGLGSDGVLVSNVDVVVVALTAASRAMTAPRGEYLAADFSVDRNIFCDMDRRCPFGS